MSDVFDDLFIEQTQLNETILNDMLSGKIALTKEGEVIYIVEFEPTKKVLLLLLANKVFVYKKIKQAEALGPKDIHQATGIPEGTVKPLVRDLQKKGLLFSSKGKYSVPNHALKRVQLLLENGGK